MKVKILKDGDSVVEKAVQSGNFPNQFPNGRTELLGEGEEIDYVALKNIFSDAIKDGGRIKEKDGLISASLHSLLPITRYQASRKGLWHYLAIFVCPEYVKKRWVKTPDFSSRFVNRWSRNAIGRLWWWAELTKNNDNDDSYEFTKSITEQRFNLWVLDKMSASNKTLTLELCRVHSEWADWAKENKVPLDSVTDEVWKHVNLRLATVVIDAMSKSEVSDLVRGCLDATMATEFD
jgi:hypothetical protein